MHVLVTGDTGLIGRDVSRALQVRGDIVVGFDLSRDEDVLDADRLAQVAVGCDAIVHCAAIKNDSRGAPADIFATNVTGTWNALRAAEREGIGRFVYLSSAQVFGVFDPDVELESVPIDDDHPRHASRPYGLSKRFAEDLCATFTRRTQMATTVLRPVAVFDEPTYEWAWRERATLGERRLVDRSFVDLNDVTNAVLLSLAQGLGSHARLTLAATDAITSGAAFAERSAFDTSAAAGTLGWRAAHTWRALVDERGDAAH